MKIQITILRGPGTKKITVESIRQHPLTLDQSKRLFEAERTLNELLPGLRFHIDEVSDA